MRVLVFGTYDAHVHPRVQILIDGLREHGHDVVELNAPLGVSTAERVATLRQPWRVPLPAARLARRWVQLVRAARRVPRPDVVLVGFLGHFDVLLARRLFRGVPIVLDHLVSAEETAQDRGVRNRAVLALLSWVDRHAVTAADLVVVDTPEHRSMVPADRRQDVAVVDVGAGTPWFAAAAGREAREARSTDELRIVFFGLFTPLQGAPVIGAALRLLADEPVRVTMIGHGQELEATRAAAGDLPSVTWVPWIDGADLPAAVAQHDVSLGIFGTSPKALRVVPTKVFQGLAAGCAVVTSDTAPQRRVLGDAVAFVAPGDAAALARTLRELAGDRARVRELQGRGGRLARSAMTARAVTAELAEKLPPAAQPG